MEDNTLPLSTHLRATMLLARPFARLALAGALLAAASGQLASATASSPLPAASCSRNGYARLSNDAVGRAGEPACSCFPGWLGADCGALDLLPVTTRVGGTPGAVWPLARNTSSWGGTITRGGDGQYHLLVSEMAQHCGLAAWQRNSFIRHATARSLEGPYTPRGAVLGTFSHNAACMDARPGGGPACVLLHVGTGSHAASRPIQTNCTGGVTPTPNDSTVAGTEIGGARNGRDSPRATVPEKRVSAAWPLMTPTNNFSFPGEPWRNATMTCGADASNSTDCVMSNPSGWVDPDGTAWLAYVLRGQHSPGGRGTSGFGLARATHWLGPYLPVKPRGAPAAYWNLPVLTASPCNGTVPHCFAEDGVIYRDAHGSFHMLFHYYQTPPGGDYGGHAHSGPAGDEWAFSDSVAFNLSTAVGAGAGGGQDSQWHIRQRPHVVFQDGRPGVLSHLITGVNFDETRPYPASCTHGSGASPRCDRTVTHLQPVRQGASELLRE